MHNMHIRGIDFASVPTIFRLVFGSVPTVWYFFDFHFITYVRMHMPITLIQHSLVNLSHDTMLKDT